MEFERGIGVDRLSCRLGRASNRLANPERLATTHRHPDLRGRRHRHCGGHTVGHSQSQDALGPEAEHLPSGYGQEARPLCRMDCGVHTPGGVLRLAYETSVSGFRVQRGGAPLALCS